MTVPQRLRRAFAVALSVLALLSAAARPVLACEMSREMSREMGREMGRQSRGAEPVAATTGQDAHAHHGTPSAPSESKAPTAPRPLGCDHLVGCVSMVVITAPVLRFAPSSVPDAAPRSVAERHDAPVRALEPPPPRV